MSLSATVSSHSFIKPSCTECNLKGLCLPIAMDLKALEKVDQIVQRGRPLQAGAHLYSAGEEFHSFYAVRAGSFKSYLVTDDGVEQVTGFYLPGEVLGFDGVGTNRHTCNVVALETSSVCEIPFDRLEELSRHLPSLQHHLFQLMGRQIAVDHQMMITLSKKNAEARIATLLVSLSQRYSRRNLSARALRLPMSRMDIGNLLGLTIETVSRTFSRLHKIEVIEVDGREVVIRDQQRLNELCQGIG